MCESIQISSNVILLLIKTDFELILVVVFFLSKAVNELPILYPQCLTITVKVYLLLFTPVELAYC